MPTGQRVFLGAVGGSATENGKNENAKIEEVKAEDENMGVEQPENKIEDGKIESEKTEDEVRDVTQMDIDPHPVSQPDEQVHDHPAQDDSSTQYYLMGLLDYATMDSTEVKTDAEKDDSGPKETDLSTQQPLAPQSPVEKAGTRRKKGRGRPAKRKSPHDEAQVAAIEVNGATEIEATEAPKEADVEAAKIIENGADPEPISESAPEKGHNNTESSQQSTTPMETDPPTTASTKSESESAPCSATTTPLEIEIHNIAGPNALTKKILEADDRIKNPPNGNAWKEIRCYRNNQDMGSLWEVRQAWYVKYQQD